MRTDTWKPGDDFAPANSQHCHARSPHDYCCTRARGHDGDHVAHTSTGDACGRWTQDGVSVWYYTNGDQIPSKPTRTDTWQPEAVVAPVGERCLAESPQPYGFYCCTNCLGHDGDHVAAVEDSNTPLVRWEPSGLAVWEYKNGDLV